MPERRDVVVLVATSLSVIGVDQLTKSAVISAIGPGSADSRLTAGNGWIALEYAENRGAAFGLFAGLTSVLVAVSIAIVVGLVTHFFRASNPTLVTTVATGAIVGGAAGNLLDRVRLGYVVDFVAIGPWPNFNVADSAVTLGVLGLTWGWWRSENDNRPARGG